MGINVLPMNSKPIGNVVCQIQLQALTDASVDHPDESVRASCSKFISAAYALRSEIAEFASQLEAESLTALELKHQQLLEQREEILSAQAALVTDRGFIDNSKRREDRALSDAAFKLKLHNDGRPDPKFTRAEKIAEWARERERLEQVLNGAREKQVDMYGYANAIEWDGTKLENELKGIDGQIENTWNRILALRGEAPEAPARIAPHVGLAG